MFNFLIDYITYRLWELEYMTSEISCESWLMQTFLAESFSCSLDTDSDTEFIKYGWAASYFVVDLTVCLWVTAVLGPTPLSGRRSKVTVSNARYPLFSATCVHAVVMPWCVFILGVVYL